MFLRWLLAGGGEGKVPLFQTGTTFPVVYMSIFVTTCEMASLESDGIISACLKSDIHLENFFTCPSSSSYIGRHSPN